MKLIAAWRRARAWAPNEHGMLQSVLTQRRGTRDPARTRWANVAIDCRRERSVGFDAAHWGSTPRPTTAIQFPQARCSLGAFEEAARVIRKADEHTVLFYRRGAKIR